MKSPLGWLFPSFKNLFFALILAGVMARGNTLLNADGDLGHHLALGRLMLTSGQIPQTDPFSFRTAGVAAVPHEWLVEIIFAALEKAFGLGGIVFFSALLIAAALTHFFVFFVKLSMAIVFPLFFGALLQKQMACSLFSGFHPHQLCHFIFHTGYNPNLFINHVGRFV